MAPEAPTRVAGYDLAQIANAAIIADVARSLGLGDRGALLGVMCAMGESSLRNIGYGDWETSGVRNPDGTPTTSIGLFQQQASWGSVADRMDPIYAAWKFFDALRRVRDWATLLPTLAIHRTQINADPNHYAKYEAPARAVLAAIPRLKAGGLMAPTIEWLRPGVGYQPAAARSMRRLEARLGRRHDCNSSYRDYDEQMQMYLAWQRYVNSGYDARYKPNHSRALHPDQSAHCMGLADDSDDWTTPGYIELAAEYGWIRTAASDPTERHHFEYQVWRDQHRNDPVPAAVDAIPKPPTEEEELMGVLDDLKKYIDDKIGGLDTRRDTAIVWVEGSAFVVDDAGGTKWNAIRGQKSVEDAIRFIGWLRDRGFREYPNQAPFVLNGYRDITGEGSIREEVAAAIRDLAPKPDPAA